MVPPTIKHVAHPGISQNTVRSLTQFLPWMIAEVGSYGPRKGRDMAPLMKALEDTVMCSFHLRLEETYSVGEQRYFKFLAVGVNSHESH